MSDKEIIRTGVEATSLMTALTTLSSAAAGENLTIPDVLAQQLQDYFPQMHTRYKQLAGWTLHYALGVLWCIMLSHNLDEKRYQAAVKRLMFLATGSGLLAVLIWKAIFQFNPRGSRPSPNKFYSSLFISHLVFVLASFKRGKA